MSNWNDVHLGISIWIREREMRAINNDIYIYICYREMVNFDAR